jgi:hypothetical protein
MELESELREHLRRLHPEVAPSCQLRLRRLQPPSSHWMTVVETAGRPRHRLLVKGPARYPRDGSMAVEQDLLERIAPRISAGNARTRSPQLLAVDADRQLLLLEMVQGQNLHAILTGFGAAPADGAMRLVELSAEWLARFHALTMTGDAGHPFGWLAEEFAHAETVARFDRYAGPGTGRRLAEVAHGWHVRHPDFRQPRCLAHGRFTPYHILVQDDRIYVVDLETAHAAYPYEDLAHFLSSYDTLFPWRRVASHLRWGLERQRQVFLAAYGAHARPLQDLDRTVMRLARLLAMARHARDLEKSATFGWRWRFRALLGRHWYRHRLRTVLAEELGALGAR